MRGVPTIPSGFLLITSGGCRLGWLMSAWLADVDLGKPPCDEEEARSWFGIGWVEEAARAEAEAHQDFEDEEIEGLLDTHTSPMPRCG